MKELEVHNVLSKKMLVSRQSAHAIQPPLSELFELAATVRLDFSKIVAVSPSFLDETFLVIKNSLTTGNGESKVIVSNLPLDYSMRLSMMAAAHGLVIEEINGDLTISIAG